VLDEKSGPKPSLAVVALGASTQGVLKKLLPKTKVSSSLSFSEERGVCKLSAFKKVILAKRAKALER
jgi:hypothetical protein